MIIYPSEVSLIAVMVTATIVNGNLDLLLAGNHLPTDGSAVIAIPEIGTDAEGALICRHNVTGIPASTDAFDNWNYISEDGQEVTVNSTIGWTVSRGQDVGVVRLERIAGVSQLEGLYKCSVERRDLIDVVTETVFVNLYWPITKVEVDIEVVSQESQEYNVTCMAVGGKVDGSSLTGPASENLGQLQPLMYQEDLRGANKYSISVMRTGATHGDVFTCRASNNVSSPSANLTLSVASPPTNVRITQVSGSTPILNITWSHPQIDAVVTNYTLHYTRGNDTGSVPAYSNTLVLLSDLIADGNDYEIIVEAESIHISGFSEPVRYLPCLVIPVEVSSQTQSSITLMWERPDYFKDSITGLIQYTALPDGDTMWLYVIESDDIFMLSGLVGMTSYAIQTAVVDRNSKLCVFSTPTIANTSAEITSDPGSTSSDTTSFAVLVGVAFGGAFIGFLVALIVCMTGYLLYRQCYRRIIAMYRRRAHSRAHSTTMIANERYVSRDTDFTLHLTAPTSKALRSCSSASDQKDSGFGVDKEQDYEVILGSQYEQPIHSKRKAPSSATESRYQTTSVEMDPEYVKMSPSSEDKKEAVANPMYADFVELPSASGKTEAKSTTGNYEEIMDLP